MNVFSQRMKEFMDLLELTPEQVSEKSGVAVKRLNSILAGSKPRLSEVQGIAMAYGVTMDYFVGLTKYPHPVLQTEIERKFVSLLEQMSDEEFFKTVKWVEESLLDEDE